MTAGVFLIFIGESVIVRRPQSLLALLSRDPH